MSLIHTLLFMLRPGMAEADLSLARDCLKSMEKGSSKALVVYNQGPITNGELAAFLKQFELEAVVIGDGSNVGISAGRQRCFEYIWQTWPDTDFISELHMDMVLTSRWEEPLVEFLCSHDEPVLSAGIVDKAGAMPFLDREAGAVPEDQEELERFLTGLRSDRVVHGFNHPCIHNARILRQVGGYDSRFLTGMQCFEDDSLLLCYYYYYGTKAGWHPKVNCNSVVYHAVALQRLDLKDSIMPNYNGLVKQYGAMGLKSLSLLHASPWHRRFFGDRFQNL